MIGTWEIDEDAVKDITDSNHQPGVCYSYFAFDQNQLHTKGAKQLCSIDQNIRFHFCIFCRKKKCFFNCGNSCKKHSWKINGHNIQVPCIGIHKYSTFIEGSISQKSSSNYRAHYICSKCFQQQGGHLYIKPGRASIAESDDQNMQKRLLSLITPALTIFNDETKNKNSPKTKMENLPSKLFVLTALRIGKVELDILTKEKFTIKTLEEASIIEEKLGKNILFSYPKIQENISQLENPSSYENYFNALPKTICYFFQALITVLEQQKLKMVNKKKYQYERLPKTLDEIQIKRTTALLTSILLTIAFPRTKIWLSHIISSICQNSKLLPYLQEKLGKNILFSYPKIQENISQLENPSSYENYFNALPKTICYFFQALITVLEQQKLKMVNKKKYQYERLPKTLDEIQIKRTTALLTSILLTIAFPRTKIWLSHIISSICQNSKLLPYLPSTFASGNIFDVVRQTSHVTLRMVFQFTLPTSLDNLIEENESVVQPLFGESLTTDNLLIMYETILNTMLENNVNEFDMEDVHSRITEQISTDCNTLPPKVVILEPCDPPNCNNNMYEACEMYRNDLPIRSNENLYVAYYRVTCRVLELIWIAVGIALCQYVKKEGKIMNDILSGNNQLMKMENLAAFAPLFPAAGKLKYASSVSHFLAQVHDDPQLRKLLQTVCSVNITNEGHYFAFDEALETYGVNFIKQNISGNLTDQLTLMLKIKAAQNEKNRLSMLLAEYIDDVAASQNVRAIKSRKDSLWSLAEKLSNAFNHPDSTTYHLFKGVPELNDEGIADILSFYETGKSRFQKILAQDVYKTEPRIAAGRRKRNIKSYTYAQLVDKEKKTNKRVDDPPQISNIQQSVSQIQQQISLPPETDHLKKARCTTTEVEKAILNQLFESEKLTETIISEVLLQLQAISSDWTTERIKMYWRNNRNNSLTSEEQTQVKTNDSGRRSWDLYLKNCHFQSGFT
ncbi:hypothetical protein Glove_131g84 [Diversispora epigaea]|uniref:Uncharacterized protein n=1 Tax=Diversispora epigaea TaxID=1348612 RepID=A0A397IXW7_9GLOM|nr:hypothetical protein Glove_131g84 [Diversispora epigaea]